jgi:DNA polymerase-3 subunit delta'
MSLQSLIGHDDVRGRLQNMWQGGRWPHAILLTGPQGIGKRLLAEHLVRCLMAGEDTFNTQQFPLNYNPQSQAVAQLDAGSCADFQCIEPEEGKKSIKAEQVRGALKKLSLTASGNYRFCIVDAADQLTISSANVLLKTLEEPSSHVYFIVLAHQIARVLPTICSRCQIVNCAPLSAENSLKVIQRHWSEVSADDIEKINILSGGAPGSVLAQDKKSIQAFLNNDNTANFIESLPANQQSIWLINRLFMKTLKTTPSAESKIEVSQLQSEWQHDLAKQQEYNLSLGWLMNHYQPRFQKVLS